MNCTDVLGSVHQYSFHCKSYSSYMAEKVFQVCLGYSALFAKRSLIKSQKIVESIRECVLEKDPLNGVAFTTDIEMRFGLHQREIPIINYYLQRPQNFDWCHISISLEQVHNNAVVCLTPLQKKISISVGDISEKFLEEASSKVGVHYDRFRWGNRVNGRLFNAVFPPISEESIPRIYKQNVLDFINYRWMKKRNKPDLPINPIYQAKAMQLIDMAFETYQLEREVMDLLKIKKENRSEYIRLS